MKKILHKTSVVTSAAEIDELLMEDTPLPYVVAIDCVIGKGEYGSSDSLTGWASFATNTVLGVAFV